MQVTGWILLALGIAVSPVVAKELLPEKTEIHEDYATAICPDEAAGQRMIADYFVDATSFVRGLEVTGCAYSSERPEPITIISIIARKSAAPGETWLLYKGVLANGTSVIGLVEEEGNNAYPPTPLQRWGSMFARGGVLSLSAEDKRGYICPTPGAAIDVVATVLTTSGAEQQLAAFRAALRRHSCAFASGEFRVTELHHSGYIEIGLEASEDWTALSAIDAQGRSVGVIYDSSMFR